MHDSDRIAGTLRQFMEAPTDRGRFDAFFALCFHQARGYLASLGRRGFRLPIDEYASDHNLNDCAIDCLAPLFISVPGRPFHLIVDYLTRNIGPDTPAAQATAHLQALVAGHIRQELHRLKTTTDPQVANIKRCVRRVMQSDDYEESVHAGQVTWRWRHSRHDRRDEMPPIDDATLVEYVTDAVHRETLMPDRCRHVFALLDEDVRLRNSVTAWVFLSVMVRVLTDEGAMHPTGLPSPRTAFVHDRIRLLADRAMAETLANDFSHLARKRALSDGECQSYRLALQSLMADFAEDGSHDLLPQYLKEQLSTGGGEDYLNRHKYVWETTVEACKERLRGLLRAEGLEP